MNKGFYVFYGVLLAALSIFTGEIVTFLMLGFILVALNNINTTLKKSLKEKEY